MSLGEEGQHVLFALSVHRNLKASTPLCQNKLMFSVFRGNIQGLITVKYTIKIQESLQEGRTMYKMAEAQSVKYF